nr:hypothetical protein Q903MT_gene4753 [Picea sitchensis]
MSVLVCWNQYLYGLLRLLIPPLFYLYTTVPVITLGCMPHRRCSVSLLCLISIRPQRPDRYNKSVLTHHLALFIH